VRSTRRAVLAGLAGGAGPVLWPATGAARIWTSPPDPSLGWIDPPPLSPDDGTEPASHLLRVGAASQEASRIALVKARNPGLRSFAGLEAAEQAILAEALAVLAGDGGPGPMDGAGPRDDAEIILRGRLWSVQVGAAFDRFYLALQTAGHVECLRLLEGIRDDARERERANLAKLARGWCLEHIALLEEIGRRMSPVSPDAPPEAKAGIRR